MKNVLVMGAVGVGLLCATVGGLLATQGRLNFEGTKNIPVLNALFTPPEEVESPGSRKDTVATARGVDAGAKASTTEPLVGDLVLPALETPDGSGAKVSRDFETGDLIHLRRIESVGVTVEEVNQIIENGRTQRRELETQQKEIDRQRDQLEERERDLAARQREVEGWLAEVVRERKKLDAAVVAFNQRVLTLPQAELPGLQAAARSVAKLLPSAGAALLVEFWDHDESPDRVTKILAVMDPDRADEILACLDPARARKLLMRRMQLVQPSETTRARRR